MVYAKMPSGFCFMETSPIISRSNPRAVSISPGVALSRRFSKSVTTSAHLSAAPTTIGAGFSWVPRTHFHTCLPVNFGVRSRRRGGLADSSSVPPITTSQLTAGSERWPRPHLRADDLGDLQQSAGENPSEIQVFSKIVKIVDPGTCPDRAGPSDPFPGKSCLLDRRLLMGGTDAALVPHYRGPQLEPCCSRRHDSGRSCPDR